MNVDISGFGLLLFLGFAILLFLLLRGVRQLLVLLPMTKARRETAERIVSVAEPLLGLLYVVSAVPWVVKEAETFYVPLVIAVLLLAVLWLSRAALRDLILGVFVKAGRVCRPGDIVETQQASGRVMRMGYRTLVLETGAGDEVILPYGQLTRDAVTRSAVVDGLHRHVFRLEPNPARSVNEMQTIILRTALNHHWASIVRDPSVKRQSDGGYEVTVFALDPPRGPEIEAAVRRAAG